MSKHLITGAPDVLIEILSQASYDSSHPDTPPNPNDSRFKRVTDCASCIFQVTFHGTATTPVGTKRSIECFAMDLETGDHRKVILNLKPGESVIRIAEFGKVGVNGGTLPARTYLVAARPLNEEANLQNNCVMARGLCAA
ncbi:MAG: hypothetical protein U1G07_11465 [Verrucomicrobiota bacterium]